MNTRHQHHPEEAMEIGFIGAGAIASALAGHLVSAGHQVTLSNRRGPDSLKDQVAALGPLARAGTRPEAAAAEMAFLSVRWGDIDAALSGLPDWGGAAPGVGAARPPQPLPQPHQPALPQALRRDAARGVERRSRGAGVPAAVRRGDDGGQARRLFSTLRTALNAAAREGLIPDNPARYVKLPRGARPHAVVWTKRRVRGMAADRDTARRGGVDPGPRRPASC